MEIGQRELQQYFELFFGTNPNPALVSRLSDGMIVMINQAFTTITGYSSQESIGKTSGELKLFIDFDDRKAFMDKVASTGVHENAEIHFRRKGGEPFVALLSGKSFTIRGVEYVVILASDITNLKKLEQSLKESELKYRVLFEHAAEMIFVMQDWKVQLINDVAETITGYTKEELLARHPLENIHPDDRERLSINYARRLRGEEFDLSNRYRFIRKDGAVRWVDMRTMKIEWQGKDATMTMVTDITEKKTEEELLEASEEHFRLLVTQMQLGLAVFEVVRDESGNPVDYRYISVNQSFEAMVELSGVNGRKLSEARYYDADWMQAIASVAHSGKPAHFEIYSKWLGKYFNVYAYSPKKDRCAIIIGDVTDKKAAEHAIEYLSFHDQLTGVYNRRYYERELNRLLLDETAFPVALVYADLNGLKLANDVFGHEAGDELLKSAAKVLESVCRAGDIVARIGGDEFSVLLPGVNERRAKEIVRQIKETVERLEPGDVVLSMSVGYSVQMDLNDDLNEMHNRAEQWMYKYKFAESEEMKRRTIILALDRLFREHPAEEEHSKRVGAICEAIAAELGWNRADKEKLGVAGRMHDIGKIATRKAVREEEQVENPVDLRHPEAGYRILNAVNAYSGIARHVLEHHERWDGSGFPKGLQGEEISLQARILSVAESYARMTAPRPNRAVLSPAEAAAEIRRRAGTQFDPELAVLFAERVYWKV